MVETITFAYTESGEDITVTLNEQATGPAGANGPNSVTSATTSDGTCVLTVASVNGLTIDAAANGGGTPGGIEAYSFNGKQAGTLHMWAYSFDAGSIDLSDGGGSIITNSIPGNNGTLSSNISTGKTLTLSATDNYSLTVAGTASVSGTNTGDQNLSGYAPLVSPSFTTPALGTPASGTLTNCTADGTNLLGYRGIPQNSKSAAYTTVLADAGKHIYHPAADTTARIWTIDSNANVPYPIGTAITFDNDYGAGVITIAITSDTLVLVGTAGSTGSRTLASGGQATAIKVSATRWRINGTGLT